MAFLPTDDGVGYGDSTEPVLAASNELDGGGGVYDGVKAWGR